MNRLPQLIGAERSVTEVAQALQQSVLEHHAPVVGAMLVTCADGVETECARAFHDGFTRYCVPQLKFSEHVAFRLANPGGQYDWGSVRIAEQQFASASSSPDEHKVMVVKINSHTGVVEDDGGPRFGTLLRYRRETPCCGALHWLLEDLGEPLVQELREAFASEGKDRLAVLRDETKVASGLRGLYAALASARLQARKAVLDIQDHRASGPTTWFVVPSATINRPGRDTEIVCGYYRTTDPAASGHLEYVGLGDDPAGYRLSERNRRLEVADEHYESARPARFHRKLIEPHAVEQAREAAAEPDPRLAESVEAVRSDRHRHAGLNKNLLNSLLIALSQVAPVPAALLLFAHGTAGIHHTWKAHRLARRLEGTEGAREILDEIRGRIDEMRPEEREAILELLTREYRA